MALFNPYCLLSRTPGCDKIQVYFPGDDSDDPPAAAPPTAPLAKVAFGVLSALQDGDAGGGDGHGLDL